MALTAREKANKALMLPLAKSIKMIRKLARDPKFTALLATEGYRIDLSAVNDMEKLLKKDADS